MSCSLLMFTKVTTILLLTSLCQGRPSQAASVSCGGECGQQKLVNVLEPLTRRADIIAVFFKLLDPKNISCTRDGSVNNLGVCRALQCSDHQAGRCPASAPSMHSCQVFLQWHLPVKLMVASNPEIWCYTTHAASSGVKDMFLLPCICWL